jgi:hypothetical protein
MSTFFIPYVYTHNFCHLIGCRAFVFSLTRFVALCIPRLLLLLRFLLNTLGQRKCIMFGKDKSAISKTPGKEKSNLRNRIYWLLIEAGEFSFIFFFEFFPAQELLAFCLELNARFLFSICCIIDFIIRFREVF